MFVVTGGERDHYEHVILISTYNRLELLKKTVQSLLSSLSDEDVKIFIMDDGSTDGTWDYLIELNNIYPDIDFEHNIKNEGLRAMMNYGLSNAYYYKPKYITYVQDDVEFQKGWLSECVDYWTGKEVGFITGHDAPEHIVHSRVTRKGKVLYYLKGSCRATHLFASTERWKKFGEIPILTPGVAAPKYGYGSKVDWWLMGHPNYPESDCSLRKLGEKVLCLPNRVKHIGTKESTWGNVENPEL